MKKWLFDRSGLIKEHEFAELLMKVSKGTVQHASREDDMYKHIDIIWTLNDRSCTFDVKGLKKHNRSDNNVDESIHWIELQNVKGDLGWLYGEADYIAFETLKDWLIVRRVHIIKLIESKVTDKSISKSKNFYTYYQRSGRKDIVVKVPTNDLREIARAVLSKE